MYFPGGTFVKDTSCFVPSGVHPLSNPSRNAWYSMFSEPIKSIALKEIEKKFSA
jgi:hypothetical protein